MSAPRTTVRIHRERWEAVEQADRAYWAEMSNEERLRITLALLDFALATGLYQPSAHSMCDNLNWQRLRSLYAKKIFSG